MVVNLRGVESQEPRTYIRKEGHFTLKCVDVKKIRMSENNNPVYRFTFKNKQDEFFLDDITITENTKWKIKQLADAFGFTYDNVNIMHFVDMYCVGWIVAKKVKNKADQIVDVFECKMYSKSQKLTNNIPAEHAQIQQMLNKDIYQPQDYDIPEDEIPF